MRNAFADEMLKLVKEDQRAVLLSGDIGNRMFDGIKDYRADRVLNCGIAEQNMIGVAAGMALNGMRPFVYTITPFAMMRCLEQIRVDACYHNVPVVIVGTGSGLSYASLGPTHHSCEDMAIMRSIPNIAVTAPSDEYELRAIMRWAMEGSAPVYIRIGKKGEPKFHQAIPEMTAGQSYALREGKDVCFLTTGVITAEVMEAAQMLEAKGLSAHVESMPFVKPLAIDRLEELSSRFDHFYIAEEHSKIGGLFGAVSEWCAQEGHIGRLRMSSISIDDVFYHEVGSQADARRYFGMSADQIFNRVMDEHGA